MLCKIEQLNSAEPKQKASHSRMCYGSRRSMCPTRCWNLEKIESVPGFALLADSSLYPHGCSCSWADKKGGAPVSGGSTLHCHRHHHCHRRHSGSCSRRHDHHKRTRKQTPLGRKAAACPLQQLKILSATRCLVCTVVTTSKVVQQRCDSGGDNKTEYVGRGR